MAVPILPDHVVEDIFTFLPSKSVGRCRSLSRAWAAALSSDDFARRHLKAANRRGGRILLLGSSYQPLAGSGGGGGYDDDDGGDAMPLIGIPSALAGLGVLQLVTNPCRGLVILEALTTGTRYVCNPSTGQAAVLPEPPGGNRASLGLGYDESTGEHKIVRIYGGWEHVGPEVYMPANSNAGAGGLWRRRPREQQKPPPGCQVDRHVPSIFAQGHVHWLAQRMIQRPFREVVIISFSLSDETFETVPLPSAIGDFAWHRRHRLAELHGHLCLFSPRAYRGPEYDIYLLHRERSRPSAWELRCRISLPTAPSPEVSRFKGFSQVIPLAAVMDNDDDDDDGRILLVESRTVVNNEDQAGSVKIFTYAPRTGDADDNLFELSGLFLTDAAVCQESLVSPPGLSM